jgi:hypothetical protein
MNQHRLVKTPEDQLRDRDFNRYCANVLKKIKVDYAITNVELGRLAGKDPAYASKAQNGTLNQKNYISIIRGLPLPARKEYIQKVFFDPIPEFLPPEVRERIDKKVAERKQKTQSLRSDSPNMEATNLQAEGLAAPPPVGT